jgi:poly-gamma-glutamate synthesis protein (capsule biosynthesis protein)
VFPLGFEARTHSAGLAPMRAYDVWRSPNPQIHLPGTPPIISSVPDERDLANLNRDIEAARRVADLVITSFHWGDYTRPFHLTDHEIRTARHCIDQGADMVVGHHHHALRGMEWYRGKPILYGLGHFVFDMKLQITQADLHALLLDADPAGYWTKTPYITGPREGWPYLPMHEDTRMTVMACAVADRSGVSDVGIVPCMLQPDGSVLPLPVQSSDAASVLRYLRQCNESQSLPASIALDPPMKIGSFEAFRMMPKHH